jgi:hypothetical protein
MPRLRRLIEPTVDQDPRALALLNAATSLLQAKAKRGPSIVFGFCSRNPELGTNQLTKFHDIREEQVEQNSDQNQIDQKD